MKISIYNEWDRIPHKEAEDEFELCLSYEGEYRKGDIIDISGLEPGRFYVVRIDQAMSPSIVYITKSRVLYPVPFYAQKENIDPLAFSGCRHTVYIRKAMPYEVNVYRNLSENTFDQHSEAGVYPHAAANIETRGESVFSAQNAINGNIAHGSHGEWPYESWGINRDPDAEFRLDFGRPVNIREIWIYERCDFPHDSWWTEGTVTFSTGRAVTLPFEKRPDGSAQKFSLEENNVTYLTLNRLIQAEDPSPFPALTQIKVFGTEAEEYKF